MFKNNYIYGFVMTFLFWMTPAIALTAVTVLAQSTAAQSSKAKGPIKIFALIGQSNMNGRGNIKVLKEKLTKDLPKQYSPSLMVMRKDVWIVGANGDGISGQKCNKHLEPGFGQWKWYAAGDRTHWRHNSRAYLDVGMWAGKLMLRLVAETKDHSKDQALQKVWKDVLPNVQKDEK